MTTPGRHDITVGEADAELDQRLSDELDAVNAAATEGIAPARELTVRVTGADGAIVAGISGWTWGVAAGIGMTWVAETERGTGVGTTLLDAFEAEARRRGVEHVYVTSFTFQAPTFYERHGYVEFARWEDLPTAGRADVHLRKVLGAGSPTAQA